MDKYQLVQQIEGEGAVQGVRVNGIPFWPFFKIHFFDRYAFGRSSVVQVSGSNLLGLLKARTYGNSKPNADFRYWAFSNSDQRRKLHGKMVDRLVDPIAEQLENMLLFETPVPIHHPLDQVATKHIRSRIDLKLRERRYEKTRKGKVQIEGAEVLYALKENHQVDIDVQAIATKFMAQVWTMEWLLKKGKPQKVFFVAPYISMGYVHALKSAGIKVVELQHGVINRAHEGYNLSYAPAPTLVPDQLWTFGESERRLFEVGPMKQFRPEQVVPIGHYYLEAISRNMREEKFQFRKLVAVSLQEDPLGDQLVPFIHEAAALDRSIGFVLVPRKRKPYDYDQYGSSENVFFIPERNIYEVISFSDLHCTMFSTCAAEALSLGRPNVLVNIAGKAQEYFGGVLGKEQFTSYAESPEELVAAINAAPLPDQRIALSNAERIVPGYSDRLQRALGEQ